MCRSCQNYLPATEFPIPANSRTVGRCHFCCKLDNEARQRESFLKYRLILESLRKSEADYKDDARIVFLVQVMSTRALLIMETGGLDYNFCFVDVTVRKRNRLKAMKTSFCDVQ